MGAPACPGFDRSAVDEEAMAKSAGTMPDIGWHLRTGHGFCGGCGLDDCHPGLCCTQERDLMGIMKSVCGLCPERVRTGQLRGVKTP